MVLKQDVNFFDLPEVSLYEISNYLNFIQENVLKKRNNGDSYFQSVDRGSVGILNQRDLLVQHFMQLHKNKFINLEDIALKGLPIEISSLPSSNDYFDNGIFPLEYDNTDAFCYMTRVLSNLKQDRITTDIDYFLNGLEGGLDRERLIGIKNENLQGGYSSKLKFRMLNSGTFSELFMFTYDMKHESTQIFYRESSWRDDTLSKKLSENNPLTNNKTISFNGLFGGDFGGLVLPFINVDEFNLVNFSGSLQKNILEVKKYTSKGVENTKIDKNYFSM
jgi:hypothetical protein